jgi:uncharacterized membrane protein YgcG
VDAGRGAVSAVYGSTWAKGMGLAAGEREMSREFLIFSLVVAVIIFALWVRRSVKQVEANRDHRRRDSGSGNSGDGGGGSSGVYSDNNSFEGGGGDFGGGGASGGWGDSGGGGDGGGGGGGD